ncbi:zinc-dependent peptidase [Flavobacterium hauense]
MEIFADLATLLFVILIALAFVYFIFRRIIEPTYILLFNKPVYVHFYPFPKELSLGEKAVLDKQFSFYRNLSERRKKYFRHRIRIFIDNYQFIGRHDIEVTEEMKVKIAATSVMLTFGMRDYLPSLFNVIIIYPDVFESQNGDYHKGEFNPAAKAIVFSWKDFQQGIDFDTDNMNLGLHEFAHVLHLCAITKRRPEASLVIYKDMFEEIRAFSANPANRNKIMNSGYLRDYAFTNQHEFMAVVFESFFESPQEFRQKLPELYKMVKVMINYREG